jgi:hypothetical protein
MNSPSVQLEEKRKTYFSRHHLPLAHSASSPTNSQLVNKPGGASDLIPMHLPELSSNARTGNEAQASATVSQTMFTNNR